jgi:hypothetical protein
LKDFVQGATTFYFGVRDGGTLIGRDKELVDGYSGKAYSVTLVKRSYWWTADIEEVL